MLMTVFPGRSLRSFAHFGASAKRACPYSSSAALAIMGFLNEDFG
jgi:hypothetical protein